ncbi:MAG: hypothetical protein HYV07_22115 [Deltaproteobacteria bacterium]|nr:hypothetical protein [Deltaproteobacteria bacterium]
MRATVLLIGLTVMACEQVAVGPDATTGLDGADVGPTFVPISVVDTNPPPNYFGVWGSGPNDVYLVGERGLIVHYDGTSWTTESSTGADDLRSISGFAGDRTYDVWAVGLSGRIMHLSLDPTTTTPQPRVWVPERAGTRADLSGVAAGRDRVVAVGVGGVVLERTEATGWAQVPSDTAERLNGVWIARNGEDAVAVGNLGAIIRRTGGTWARERVTGLVTQLNEVWGTAPDQLLIVGLDGTVLRSSGTEWEALEGAPRVNLRDVAGISVGNAFIVGMSGTLAALSGREISLVADASVNRLEAVWGTMMQLDAGVADGGPTEKPLFYVVGVSGTVLVGP